MSEDRMLIVQMNAGSKKAFASLYDKYVSMVYGYVYSVLKDSTLAEDITQFCFMKLWEHRSIIAQDRNLPAWLYVTA
ncbi:MAG: RNA polymerase subunit sigma-70, partial [Bacteroidales bacterium]|nr:RNA polymerase subunit sigma-70 [Bacteroidales bacterium]